jgi:hypothetical protein
MQTTSHAARLLVRLRLATRSPTLAKYSITPKQPFTEVRRSSMAVRLEPYMSLGLMKPLFATGLLSVWRAVVFIVIGW